MTENCEDNSLVYDGVVHDGKFAQKEGLKGPRRQGVIIMFVTFPQKNLSVL
ncbi:hypothetical protein KKC_08267 [Listeria fleischmannii subsp. coloradonensis]|nr:hypothetical protein KKC_08267 [Listeria fleischmannii subsp. coloradonensis]